MSLLIYLPLNGTLDNYGQGSIGTASGTAKWLNDTPSGIGKSFDLSSRITFAQANSSIAGLREFTICFWAKHYQNASLSSSFQDSIGFTDVPVSGSGSGQLRWETSYSTSSSLKERMAWYDNSTCALVGTSSTGHTYWYLPSTLEWHHYAISITSSAVKSYCDGELVSTITTNINGGSLRGDFWLGETNNINGCISDVRVYDEALSDKTINKLANLRNLTNKKKQLLVWMPLISDLHNQGTLNPTITTTGNAIAFTASGKIGPTSYSSNTDVTIQTNYSFTKNWSICFWARPLSSNITANWTNCFYASDGGSRARCEFCPTSYSGGGLCFTWNNNTSYNTWTGGMSPSTGAQWYNKWTHCVLTGDTEHVTLYLNGNQIAQGTATEASKVFNGQFVIKNGDKINLNDLRIYNYTLTQKEIKNLYNGLIVHHSLNGFKASKKINPNLGKNCATYANKAHGAISTNPGAWGGDQGTITYYHYGGYNNYPYKKVVKTSGGTGGIYEKVDTFTLEAGKTYTFSCWIKANSAISGEPAHTFNINRQAGNYYITAFSGALNLDWKFYSKTVTIDNDSAGVYGEMSIVYAAAGTEVYYSGFKIEEGTQATPWVPSLSSQELINADGSGFRYNLSTPLEHIYNKNTARYSQSLSLNTVGVNTLTHPRSLTTIATEQEWTCCAWVKLNSTAITVLNNFNSGCRIRHSANGNALLYLNSGTNDYYNYSNQVVPANTWTHIAFVFKNATGTKLIYINGVDCTNTNGPNKTSTPAGIPDPIILFSNLDGLVSDYREYATALTATDIQNLYQMGHIPV